MEKQYNTFWEFYPYYLTEHSNRTNRYLHFAGTAGVIGLFVWILVSRNWSFFWLLPICGYGFAWVGHFFVEKNKPATFTYPLYSLGSDFVMFWHILSGQIDKKVEDAHKVIKK